MFTKVLTNFLLVTLILGTVVAHVNFDLHDSKWPFDPDIYEEALDSEICEQQLHHIAGPNNGLLRLSFVEAGLRLPRAILKLNNLDMGNYEQCLEIYHELDDSVIEGKYCRVQVPVNTNLVQVAEEMNWSEFDTEYLSENNIAKFQKMDNIKSRLEFLRPRLTGPRSIPGIEASELAFELAVCVPKTCTVQEGIAGILFNTSIVGVNFDEQFCRFKGDKRWVPVDYVAVVLFSVLGLITLLSSAYDVWQVFIRKRDSKSVNILLKSFSVYTNAKRLTTFTSSPNNLSCVNGIRAISMFWIILGHSYSTLPPVYNNVETIQWILSFGSLWITAAPYAVDTFFFLGGLLVVYTTVGKLTSGKLLKSLHLFYLHRILRMLPLLAAIILLQASVFHHIADGPLWNNFATKVQHCRTYWWSTLLFIQNYVAVQNLCIDHSWYLAIDMQCYIISPLVLYWVLSGKRTYAWSALSIGVLATLIAGSTYSFINKFSGWIVTVVPRPDGHENYDRNYYLNTINRASTFFVGMLFGYLLSVWKDKKPKISNILASLLWILSIGTLLFLMYITHLMKGISWDTWVVDDLMNSFARPLWGAAIGWVIFACQHSYGGPVNWFLSLDIWKLTSRISFAMYLFHYKLQLLRQATALQPIYFSDSYAIGVFMQDAVIAYTVGFFMTLLIDSPFSILFKYLFGTETKKPCNENKE